MMKKYYVYIRVSSTRQRDEGYSLEEQRSMIEAYTKRNSLAVKKWVEEVCTAKKTGRKLFNQMLKEVRADKNVGVIFHKIDRSMRNYQDWAEVQNLLDSDIDVRIVADDLDLTSRSGRLTADILAALASDYVRNLSQEVDKGQKGCLSQGLYPWHAPIGYVNTGTARKEIDPIKAPLVRVAYELYATGRHSLRSLLKILTAKGLRTASGRPLTKDLLHRLLRNRFYYGLISSKGTTYTGSHESIITKRLFDRVQAVLTRSSRRNTGLKSEYALRQLIRCGKCSHLLYAETQKGRVYYRCHSDGCQGTSLRETTVLAEMVKEIAAMRLSDDLLGQLAEMFDRLASEASMETEERMRLLELKLSGIRVRREKLLDAFVDSAIDKQTFESRSAAYADEQYSVEADLRDLTAPAGGIAEKRNAFFELLKDLKSLENEKDSAEIGIILKEAISNCTVHNKNLQFNWRIGVQLLLKKEAIPSCGHLYDMHRRPCASSPHSEAVLKNVAECVLYRH